MSTMPRLAWVGAAAAALFLGAPGALAAAPEPTEPAAPSAPAAEPAATPAATPAHETNCTDGVDNDGDTVTDCGDHDCAKDPACQPDGKSESTDARCSDWVDNDSDGHVDCDDSDCLQDYISVCKGSWKGPLEGGTAGLTGPGGAADEDIPELGAGQTVEDLIGKGGDKDGERNDMDCSDGIDNDGDGRTDCADFGCRFDPSVSVCRGAPGLRFSVVGQVTGSYDLNESKPDVRFSTLQLRAFGPMPFIQDSFFLVSMRTEKTPRLTFAMFQVPIGGGHYVNINSGGGGLSSALIRSASKQLVIDAPYYLYNAFEQGNGAAVEVGGPLTGKLKYRAFVAGGSGRFAGNVGGRYFTYDNTNFTWTAGAQLAIDAVGHVSRWDNPMLYTRTPTAIAFAIGAKYDQRAQERYPAANLQFTLRHQLLIVQAESYLKREVEFGSWQVAYNVAAGFLLVPKHLLLAADFGQYIGTKMDHPPKVAETDIKKQRDELMWRAALHWYFWRNVGVLSAVFSDRYLEASGGLPTSERIIKLVGQYRF